MQNGFELSSTSGVWGPELRSPLSSAVHYYLRRFTVTSRVTLNATGLELNTCIEVGSPASKAGRTTEQNQSNYFLHCVHTWNG
jgi:hypothetical protein